MLSEVPTVTKLHMSEKASIHIDIRKDEEKSIDGSQYGIPTSLDDIDPRIEANIRRKYDLRVLPIAILIYLMAFIDR